MLESPVASAKHRGTSSATITENEKAIEIHGKCVTWSIEKDRVSYFTEENGNAYDSTAGCEMRPAAGDR